MLGESELTDGFSVSSECKFYRRLLELSAKQEIGTLIEEATSLIIDVTGAKQAYLELGTGDDGDEPWWLARGCSDEDVQAIRLSISRGIIAEALATGQTIRTASALADPRFRKRTSVKRHAIKAVLCAPVGALPTIGAVYLQGRTRQGPFSREDELRAELLARQLAPLADRLVTKHQSGRDRDYTSALREQFRCDSMIGRSASLAEVLRQAALVAPLEVAVLLTGPSGTGKTALAQLIAQNSRRSTGPFVELNCAALPESLLESELFGAVRGGHSTANRAVPGKLAKAEGGTLLLDEIAELSLGSQAKLLQLLQSGKYYPLGAADPVTANVRIMSATNVELGDAVSERRFREDLFYRLHVMPIRMPSLAERREDIDLLLGHFLGQAVTRHQLTPMSVSAAAQLACREATWPGNLRQLGNAVEAAVIRAHGERCLQLEAHHMFPERAAEETSGSVGFQEATRSFQRRLLIETLQTYDWNVAAAGRALELTRSHMYNLIHAHGLSRERSRSSIAAPEPPRPSTGH